VTDAVAQGIDTNMSTSETPERKFNRLLAENRAALKRLVAGYAGASNRDDLLQDI